MYWYFIETIFFKYAKKRKSYWLPFLHSFFYKSQIETSPNTFCQSAAKSSTAFFIDGIANAASKISGPTVGSPCEVDNLNICR